MNKKKMKYPILMNVVILESFVVKNTQPLRRSSRPSKATEEVIGLDKKTVALSIFFKKKSSNRTRRPSTITTPSQEEPTVVFMTGISSISLDRSVAITETLGESS